MKNKILQDIVEYATTKLREAYGYCGVAANDEMAMINSDDREGNDIKITIEIEAE